MQTYIRNGLILILVFAMGWQQWKTFQKYEKEFIAPVKFTQENYGKDYITGIGHKYDAIRNLFPGKTYICYLGEGLDDFPTWSANYSFSQYFLSPNVLIKDNTNCDTILYNLHWSIRMDKKNNYHLNNGWHIVNDFNNGLIVLAK